MIEVVLAVWAYNRGGAGMVAVVAASIFVPATIGTPALIVLADRSTRRELSLLRVTSAFSLIAAATGVAIVVDMGAVVVVLLAATAVSVGTAFRPISSSLLLWVARNPAELIGAHAEATAAEKAGGVFGAVTAAVCVERSGPAFGAFVAAVVLIVPTVLVLGVRAPGQRADRGAMRGVASVARAVFDGASTAARMPALVVFVLLQGLVMSAFDVLIVVLAFDLLGGNASVGWLQASLGAGGILGGAVAVRLLRNVGTGSAVVLAVAVLAVPLLGLGELRRHPLVFAAIVFAGLGDSLVDVALRSALPRAFGLVATARVTAAIELVAQLSITGGAILALVALHFLDVHRSLVVLGCLLVMGAAAFWRPMKHLDAALSAPGSGLAVLRTLPMFAAMPLAVMEVLSGHLRERTYDDGEVVIREGDPGDSYHVIVRGAADATADGAHLRSMGPNDGFGEIALLRDVLRTATVTARGSLRTVQLGREPFLAAVTGQHDAFTAASLIAEDRLRHG